jgi:hypothetical protein
VTLITRNPIGAFTVNVNPNPRLIGYLSHDIVVEGYSKAERIETRS